MRRQRGFTLIEMMVAMAIFALIGVAAYSVFNQVSLADRSSQEASKRLAEVQQAMLTIERDMTQLSSRQVRFPNGDKQSEVLAGKHFFLDSEDDGILFTRRGWQNPSAMLPRSEIQLAAYRLEKGELIKQYYFYPDPEVGVEPQRQVLLTGVEELKIRYYDGENWQDNWAASELPQAIAITLKLKDYGEIVRRFATPSKGRGKAKEDS
ncbi:type II secretion system minor pseudopilin GspJ [Gallaecimonas pentaromativorans]|uniref:Type II secretion system protein J n=1 Tax=Gallaecimonas pentaromativorans TaxID=584787 RepID=A0A3N1NWV4_9GAMM|nr:type II secretion system minor pseudopilin GspJ [Gallaecimonas pentaromativorans]ROQ18910.1 type II secretion system protein J (GspJ) [Gallaecimonas pentaromativorans]